MTNDITTKCAGCGRHLARFVTTHGRLKHMELYVGPYRQLTVFRVVTRVPVEQMQSMDAYYAPRDDFRPRYVKRDIDDPGLVTVTEMPYVCDSDTCEEAVRSSGEWQQHKAVAERHVIVPGKLDPSEPDRGDRLLN